MFDDVTIAFIGSGNMGEAMIQGLLKQQMIEPERLIAADPRPERLDELHNGYGIRTTLQSPRRSAGAGNSGRCRARRHAAAPCSASR